MPNRVAPFATIAILAVAIIIGTVLSNTSQPVTQATPQASATAAASPTATPSASAMVETFYADISARDYTSAYALLSKGYQRGTTFAQFRDGYTTTKSVKVTTEIVRPGVIAATLYTEDEAPHGVRDRIYKGTWSLVYEDGSPKLDSGDFKTVADSMPQPLPTATNPLDNIWNGTAAPVAQQATAQPANSAPAAYAPPARSSDCEDDSIKAVSEDGSYIFMLSGSQYHVMGGDEATAAVWLAGDDVKVCSDKIINTDENGETVDIY